MGNGEIGSGHTYIPRRGGRRRPARSIPTYPTSKKKGRAPPLPVVPEMISHRKLFHCLKNAYIRFMFHRRAGVVRRPPFPTMATVAVHARVQKVQTQTAACRPLARAPASPARLPRRRRGWHKTHVSFARGGAETGHASSFHVSATFHIHMSRSPQNYAPAAHASPHPSSTRTRVCALSTSSWYLKDPELHFGDKNHRPTRGSVWQGSE